MKQLKLFPELKIKTRKVHGPANILNQRKIDRPLAINTPHHLGIKIKDSKNSGQYFSPFDMELKNLLTKAAERYTIQIYEVAFNWTHIHVVIRFSTRLDYTHFIRYFTSQMMRILSARHGKNLKGLFEAIPFTRIVSWGRDLENVRRYTRTNAVEAVGGLDVVGRLLD